MKTFFYFITLLAMPVMAFGQSKAIDDIFVKFDGKPGITSVTISKELMNLAAQLDSNDFKAKDIFAQINSVRILAFEKATSEDKAAFDNMIKALPLTSYKELMVIKDKGNTVKMLTQQNEGRITEFLLLVTGDKEPVIVSIIGNINPKDLGKLSACTHMNGFKYLEQLNHKK